MSEVECEAQVDLTAGHIVGNSVGNAVDVSDPIVVADIGDVKQIEKVNTGLHRLLTALRRPSVSDMMIPYARPRSTRLYGGVRKYPS